MRDYRFFVYMLNSSSRRALYTGMNERDDLFCGADSAYTGIASKRKKSTATAKANTGSFAGVAALLGSG
jgi:hypothetical protein